MKSFTTSGLEESKKIEMKDFLRGCSVEKLFEYHTYIAKVIFNKTVAEQKKKKKK